MCSIGALFGTCAQGLPGITPRGAEDALTVVRWRPQVSAGYSSAAHVAADDAPPRRVATAAALYTVCLSAVTVLAVAPYIVRQVGSRRTICLSSVELAVVLVASLASHSVSAASAVRTVLDGAYSAGLALLWPALGEHLW